MVDLKTVVFDLKTVWGATQRGDRPAWYPRDFSVKEGVVSLLRGAVAAFAAALLEVTATSWFRPREASTAKPLAASFARPPALGLRA